MFDEWGAEGSRSSSFSSALVQKKAKSYLAVGALVFILTLTVDLIYEEAVMAHIGGLGLDS